MTLDELWRLNLDRAGAGADRVDKAVAAGLPAVLDENPNQLRLAADNRVFLLEVVIRPVKEPAPLEARKRRQPEIPTRENSEKIGSEARLQTQLNLRVLVS